MLSLAEQCGFDHRLVDFFAFDFSQIIDVAVMKRAGHTVLDAFGIAVAQIAFSGHPLPAFKVDTPKGAGADAQFAAHTTGFGNNDGLG
jgi:hypothetical protein